MFESLMFREPVSASEWCEKNLVLPRSTSPNAPGPLSFDRQPYLREILDCSLDPAVETVVVSAGAQIGKTVLLLSTFGAFVGLEPGNGVWSMTSLPQMREFSDGRLQDFVLQNAALSKNLDAEKTRPLFFRFNNMALKLTGAGSPSNLASYAARFVIADEAAKYQWTKKQEAPPIKLLMERTKAFSRRYHIFASTPTVIENDFWQLFMTTDMREYAMPCPACGEEFVFQFSDRSLVWDKTPEGLNDPELAARTARYVCPHCGREIWDSEKQAVMARGRWRSSEWLRKEYAFGRTRGENKRARGYWLSSLYSPFLTFGAYAREFLLCLQKETKYADLQNLRNSWEALPWERVEVQVKNETVRELCGDLPRGVVPENAYFVAVGYDPGGTETHWVAVAFCPGGEMYVVDWGTILQPLTEWGVAADGSRYVKKPGIAPHFSELCWGGIKPRIGFVDAGYMTGGIYSECYSMRGVLNPTKGSTAKVGTWNVRPAGDTWPGLEVVTYSDYMAKMSLYGETIALRRGAALHLPRESEVDEALCVGLSGQKLVRKGQQQVWRDVREDHFGDCIKICRVGWWVVANMVEEVPEVAMSETGLE